MLRERLPPSFNSLTVFEDSYSFYDLFQMRPKTVDRFERLGQAFAAKCLTLNHLAISFLVNAEELFRHSESTWSWPHLQSLALTSQLLHNEWEKREQIEDLLCRASDLARKMPKLHTFVLSNGGKAHACAFIYRVDGDRASITWRGTLNLEFSPRVVEL